MLTKHFERLWLFINIYATTMPCHACIKFLDEVTVWYVSRSIERKRSRMIHICTFVKKGNLDRKNLITSLKNYSSKFAEEKSVIKQFLELLMHPEAFQRDHLPGHVTGSSWIVDDSRKFTLLTHHATLNKWLQPGGHADGEENVLNVARREAEEETGLKVFTLLQENIFDLDIHPIPARNGFPDHLHYDIRFLFEANKGDTIIISEESLDVAWQPLDELKVLTLNNPSIMRMVHKLKSFP